MTNTTAPNSAIPCSRCGSVFEYSAALRGLCPSCLFGQATDHKLEEPSIKSSRFRPPALNALAPHFAQLEIQELLGSGGMSAVYKAIQRSLGRTVALKVLPPEIASIEGGLERFQREGKMLAQLDHPHIVQVLDAGQSGPWYYILMEYVAGPNLRQVIGDRKLPNTEVLRIAAALCEALQYSHDRGIIHRALNPEHVLLGVDGVVKLADFGLARTLEPNIALGATQTGQVLGTAQYIAPEQFEMQTQVDHRADIYALGVMLYEMMTGEVPMGNFLSPSERSGADPKLDAIVLKALARDRNDRFQNASDFHSQLAAANRLASSENSKKLHDQTRDQNSPTNLEGTASKKWFAKSIWELVLSLCSLLAACIGFVGVGNLIDAFSFPHDGPKAQILFGFPLMTFITATACMLSFFFARMGVSSVSSWSGIRWPQLPSMITLVAAYAMFTLVVIALPGIAIWMLASVPKWTQVSDWRLFGNPFTDSDRVSYVTKYWLTVWGIGAWLIAGWNVCLLLATQKNQALLEGIYHPTSTRLAKMMLTRIAIGTCVLGITLGLVFCLAGYLMN